MPRYKLRYHNTDLGLAVGEFSIGRSSDCSLTLDDALTSRRHAVLHVTEEGVKVEDLGSRNGVLVNGTPVKGTQELSHMDLVNVGAQELLVVEVDQAAEAPRVPPRNRQQRAARSRATIEMAPVEKADPHEVTRRATGFELLTAIAAKAFALQRYEEAERLLAKHLDQMLAEAKTGAMPAPENLTDATEYALQLASGLSQPRWIDWLFDIYLTCHRVPSTAIVDTMHDVVRRIGYSNAGPLRSYLEVLRGDKAGLSPADRFVLQRLEGLERVITA